MLNSFTALVAFLCGGLGFANLPPIPPATPPPAIPVTAPSLAPGEMGDYLVKLTPDNAPEVPPHIPLAVLRSAAGHGPQSAVQINLLVKKYSQLHGLDENLVRAVLRQESGGNPLAVSPKGALGLMQLMPETAQLMGVEHPFNPEENLAGGVKYLRLCLDRFRQDVVLALAAYNAGPEAVTKHGGVPPFPETQQYVASILGYPVPDALQGKKATSLEKNQEPDPASSPETGLDWRLPKPTWNVPKAKIKVQPHQWKTLPASTRISATRPQGGKTTARTSSSMPISSLP